MIFLRHNMMIIGRPPSLHPPISQDHEVRLPYWCGEVAELRMSRCVRMSRVLASGSKEE